ncbi:glycosyltransferase [Algoriphagus lacus]|uniref:Glycosyltransferase n=1 Tax=Algoriphagus lacus TaxID=2056311 RepID=A0A418PMQ5_9BACT|nr:glycosyltransferase [Algoriphagus lacus]RIW13086.1 glycosyltransferase [Algoriphagus lacus]
MPAPLFSIIVPCYNQGHFLSKAVESVIAQGFKDWELWIINDGSTDQTGQIAQKLSASDARIEVITQSNLGLSAARNSGIKVANGNVLHFLDADDWLLPGCLEQVAEKFKDPEIDVCISGYSYYLGDKIIHTHRFQSEEIFLPRVVNGNLAPPVSFFVKKEVLESVGDFDISLKSCEDWDLWIRAAKSGFRIHSMNQVLVAYRYVAGSMSKKPKQMYAALCEVSSRAAMVDSRISVTLPLNKDYDINLPERFKIHFINCLGVSLFQGLIEESKSWFEEEKFKWSFSMTDWEGLSSNLSFKHFLTPELIQKVLTENLPSFHQFFISIGYSENETKKILKRVFSAQFKKRNHLRFGRILGGIINKLSF